MLNNLNWLMQGQSFPPACEKERLHRYIQNKRIFDNNHAEVYKQQWKRIEKVVGSMAETISYPIVLNYQKKISLKTADFLFIEPPIFTAGKNKDDNKNKVASKITNASRIIDIGYQGAIDCSRYGTTVYKIDKVDNKGQINISSPEYLFTVVDTEDRKKVTQYVIAWITSVTNDRGKDEDHLIAYIHSKGSHTKRVFVIEGEVIGRLIEEEADVKTGLDDFAIIPVHNLQTSDSVYGIDDYMDVDSIIAEIEIRTAQISKILDVHANPTVSGSHNALTHNKKTDKYYFEAGNYYARNSMDEPPLEYIIWNASLDANFKQIEKLLNHLSVISEMGAAVFDGELKAGNLPSGTALKRLYINVLAKVARVRNSFDYGFKKAIATASQLGYDTKLNIEDISITWQDGLPNDPKETAEIISLRTGNQQTMSIERAIMDHDGLEEKAVEEEVGRIEASKMIGTSGMTIAPSSNMETKDEE